MEFCFKIVMEILRYLIPWNTSYSNWPGLNDQKSDCYFCFFYD